MKISIRSVPGDAKKNLDFALKNIKSQVAKAGWGAESRYPNGTPVAYVATIQEYGVPAKKIDARPFMRTTVAEQQITWKAIIAQEVKKIMRGESTTRKTLEIIGQVAAGDVRKKIASIREPGIAKSTYLARKRKYHNTKKEGDLRKPLVDTALMINSITSVVEENDSGE